MKIKIMLIVTLFMLAVPSLSYALICYDLTNLESPPPSIALGDYTAYATTSDNKNYEICFTGSFPIEETVSINVENPAHILKVSGLNLSTSNLSTFALQLSGSNITLDNVTLTGNGSGTAIEVSGKNNTIQNTKIDGFESGIQVDPGASVKLNKNTYLVDPANILVNFAPSPIIKLGKALSKDNPKIVDYVIGELNAENCVAPTGTIEVYQRITDVSALQYHVGTKCSVPQILSEDVKFEYPDKQTETLKAGVACAFKCENLNEGIETKVAVAYTSSSGASYGFYPLPLQKFSDMISYVPSTGLGGIAMVGTTSGANDAPTGVSDETGGTTTGGIVGVIYAQPNDPDYKSGSAGGDLINTGSASSSSGCSMIGESFFNRLQNDRISDNYKQVSLQKEVAPVRARRHLSASAFIPFIWLLGLPALVLVRVRSKK